MLIRNSHTSPARLEANRRNAQKSTGPRTPRGKSQSRLNRLRGGGRSRLYQEFLLALADSPPGAIDETARAALTPAQAAHPLFAPLLEIFTKSEGDVARWCLKLLLG